MFPTIKHLEQLGEFALGGRSCWTYARGRDGAARSSRKVVLEGEVARVLLPASRATSGAWDSAQRCCWASITCVTALISARCVKACG